MVEIIANMLGFLTHDSHTGKFAKRILTLIFAVFMTIFTLHAQQSYQPADSLMIDVAKNMLTYFDTIYQKKMLGAMRGPDQALTIQQLTGEYPAMVEEDLTGWHKTAWSDTYTQRVQSHINTIKNIWNEKKAIPGMCWHWGNPLTGGGTYDASKEELTAAQFNNLVTPGTDEYTLMMEDLRKHADYLQQLTEENIPLIWRPLHEIDGGWFWWTDKNNPENTVKLWKILYKYLVHEREMHNLIWVYSAGLGNPTKKDLEYRQSYYPGDAWCDMVGIDLYGWDFRDTGIKEYWNATESYRDAFDVMKALAPEKLIILTETDAMPNVNKTFQEDSNFAKWLWAMPWYAGNDENPDEWILKTYTHENIIMQPDLPDFTINNSPSAISPKQNDNRISIYPLPAQSYLSVKPIGNYNFQVYDLMGRQVAKETDVTGISIEHMTSGVYLVAIETADNIRFIKKFLKE